MLAHRLDRAGLHLGQALAVGEHRGAGLLLHHRPQRLLDQVADLAAGPRAVVDLREPFVDDRFEPEGRGQRRDGALAAQQRRPHDRLDRQVADRGRRRASACSRPLSSRSTPSERPASVCAVLEVERPWRSRMTVMGSGWGHCAATTPVPSRTSSDDAEDHAVADEPVHAVAHQEFQEPGDRRVADDEGDDGRRRAAADRVALMPSPVGMEGVGQREQPGGEHGRDGQQEAEPRGGLALLARGTGLR